MGLVVLADRDERFVEGMRAVLGRDADLTVDVAPTAAAALDAARSGGAIAVVLGPSIAIETALEVGSQLDASTPPIAAILVAQRVTTELLRMALRAGLRDVLSASDQTYGEVAKSVREAQEAAAARAAQATPDGTVASASEARVARVVTVFSPKGGVGKSVLATNIGVALASAGKRKVVLIDLDLESGDVGIMLNLKPTHTILDAAQAIDRLDLEMLSGLLVAHGSGLLTLLAPVHPEEAEMVTAARVGRIIELCRQVADVVVIDTPGCISEVVLTAIDKSDVVLAVSAMDMPSVKNMRVALQKLGQLGYRDGLMKLALNRADSKVLLEVADVEAALGSQVFARIPSDRLVPRSVNKGIPIVSDEPKSGVARSITELAEALAGPKEAK
jgi:pilus assembly protein CpaE